MERILLVLPLRAAQSASGVVYIDSQACNGLRLWLRHFDRVTIACPTEVIEGPSPTIEPISKIEGFDRLTFVPLPVAYAPHRMLAHLPAVARLLKSHIGEANYLHFAIGGLWGDWAALACLIAQRLGLPYAVWTDRVESDVGLFSARSKIGIRKLYTQISAWLTAHSERITISSSALGLFHGSDCFQTFAPRCRNPHLVHNIHVRPSDRVTKADIAARGRSVSLRIAYAGQAKLEKGIYDWIDALKIVADKGVSFEAVWFGDGPERIRALTRTLETGLSDRVSFPGSLEHRDLLAKMKAFDIFVFCHKTKESPRCLIEAMVCGLPLVGYDSDFAADIAQGNALLTPMNDPTAVANSITLLAKSAGVLQGLTDGIASRGRDFTDEAVFRHRSELMKTIRIND